MAGGGVGEAMLIGAAMGAGTGAVTSAIDKRDPLEGALMGAVGGAAMGGLGSAVGGAATTAAEQVGQQAVQEGIEQGIQQGATSAAQSAAQTQAMQGMTQAGMGFDAQQAAINAAQGSGNTAMAGDAMTKAGMNFGQQEQMFNAFQPQAAAPQSQGIASWMGAGKGEGFAPGLTNAQAYGAGAAGGISGISAAQNMPQTEAFPTEEDDYSGPLSFFKYDPQKYRVNEPTPNVYQPRYGMAEGGIASLSPTSPIQNPVYPQSQQNNTAFSTSPQMPNSMRAAMASDYDARTDPRFGTELPMGFAGGGGIGFINSIQPGGTLGNLTSDLYGAVQQNKPEWLQKLEPGGFIGATVPGKSQWDAEQQKKKEEEEARKRAEEEAAARAIVVARNTSMQGMAGGGIASLGGYSDGGRLLKGPGDGVSDSIPASIGGRQPARLADGEFVIPARIVSELGNGSTDAGARRLYDMMDRVQARRHKTMGKGKIAKNTRAHQALPA